MDKFFDRLIAFFTSLRLTVVCLALAMVIVFLGTMAQEPMGLYLAQEKFFHSFFVPAAPMWAAVKKTFQMVHIYMEPSTIHDVLGGPGFPVFPGGYLIGGVLLINLVASHYKRFHFTRDKAGIWMVHFGLILLLLGQLLTDRLSRETILHLREGETRNYSESQREIELAIADVTAADSEKVVAIPQATLMDRREIRHSELPFAVRVKEFMRNSTVEERPAGSTAPAAATQGIGARAVLTELPRITEMDRRDVSSAVIELLTPQGSLGTWLVSEHVNGPQSFTLGQRTYEIEMRLRRFYKPFSLQLLEFRHDVYPGTDIPKNFSSRVRLEHPATGENREALIYMNSPLRYGGETYYQSSFDPDNKGTILQVVHNPSWLTPYLSCILVGVGLLLQFWVSLLGFASRQRSSNANPGPGTKGSTSPSSASAPHPVSRS
jgi:hypothetical protein